MTEQDNTGPVAIPQQPAPSGYTAENTGLRASGKDAPPSGYQPHDPGMEGFAKVAAERRERQSTEQPWTIVPFGNRTIRIYTSMPAEWAYLASAAVDDPRAAFAAIGEAIYVEDRPLFEQIRKLPPDNPEGIDGIFLVAFLDALGSFYGGVPTPAS